MITQRGEKLVSQLNSGNVDWQLAIDCLQSQNIFEQGVAFEVFTGRARDEIVPCLPKNTDVPMLLLEHLLSCIREDVSPELESECQGFVYDKGGAFLDLRVPLDPAWQKFDRLLPEEKYFQRIAEFLKENPREYQERLATHVLEAWSPTEKPFSGIMKSWKNDAVLARYVDDLEDILQHVF